MQQCAAQEARSGSDIISQSLPLSGQSSPTDASDQDSLELPLTLGDRLIGIRGRCVHDSSLEDLASERGILRSAGEDAPSLSSSDSNSKTLEGTEGDRGGS